MDCNTKLVRIAGLLVIGFVMGSGCEQSKTAYVPPAKPIQQDQQLDESTSNPSEDASTNDGNTVLPDGDAGTEPETASVDDTAKPTAGSTSNDTDVTPLADEAATGIENADLDLAENGEAAANADDVQTVSEIGAGETADIGTVAAENPDTRTTPPTERFALLTPDGPLVVDVIITIDGDVHSLALEELVDEAFAAADTDGDGKRTWKEVADSPKFMYGQFGNLPITDDTQKRQLVTMYDRNDDGLVDREELPRFVTRNVGRARSFSLKSSNEFRSANRSRSPLRRLLDVDHNGAMTQEEMAAAPARLLSRDADDDQIITLADFKDDTQAMPGQMSNRRRTSEPDTAFLISDRTKWAYASFALRELYAFGDPIGAGDWPLTPELFKTLDVDENEQLDREEVEQLATVKPHLRLLARFGVKQRPDGPRETTLELDLVDPSIEAAVTAVRTHQRRVSIELSRVEIEFFVNEDPSLSNYEEVAKGQFNTLDTDGNGYLEETEFPAQLPGFNVPFAGVDADSDGKVYLEELASFLDLRQRAYRGQVRARAADQEDALFTALDTSGDGRLHAREIAAAPSVLKRMDLNQDGHLQSHEIPGSMVVGFVRGNPQQDNNLFVMPTGTNNVEMEKLPRWFLGMDTNRDGEIGAQEFLGTADRFAAFDKNQDGFINPSELPKETLDVESPDATESPDAESPDATSGETEPAVDAPAAEPEIESRIEASGTRGAVEDETKASDAVTGDAGR